MLESGLRHNNQFIDISVKTVRQALQCFTFFFQQNISVFEYELFKLKKNKFS